MSGSIRRAAAGIVAALLLASSVACTHDDPDRRYGSVSPLPTQSATPTASPSPSGTQGMSDREQVKALYLDFIVHYPKAQDMAKARRRAYLGQWLIDPALTGIDNGIKKQVDKHEHFEGAFEPHVFSVKVSNDRAAVQDCADQSHTLLRSTITGEVVNRGPNRRAWIIARMKRTTAGWRIYYTNSPVKSCAGHS